MQTTVILSVIGPDRPGLVDRLSAAVVAASGNWEGSRMLRLGGQFAGMVQVVLAEEALPALEESLASLDKEGLHSRLHRAAAGSEDEAMGAVYELEVVGQDRQGIVKAIAGALARLGVNVLELATDCGEAPWSGERIFKTVAKIYCPESLGIDALREAIESIGLDLMVELNAVA